jgi:hypothetical protein
MWHTALWSCTHIPNIIDLSHILERQKSYAHYYSHELYWVKSTHSKNKSVFKSKTLNKNTLQVLKK